MNELAEKIAKILGVSADKIGTVYPDMVRAWWIESMTLIAFGAILLSAAGLAVRWFVRNANELDDPEVFTIFGGLGVVVVGLAGVVCILFNVAHALYPEATLVYSLLKAVKP